MKKGLGNAMRVFILAPVLVVPATLAVGCSNGVIPILRETKTYSTKSIVRFEQLQGQPQWAGNAQQRVWGATWTFRPDGTFSFAPADARDDLFPIEGQFNCSSSLCNFSAQSSSSTGGTGAATASIQGTLDFSGVEPVLEMTQATSMINAAVVNDVSFGQGSTTSYRFTVTLQ